MSTRIGLALAAIAIGAAGCANGASVAAEGGGKVPPAKVEVIAGRTDVKKVTLTERAAQRVAVKTVSVAAAPGSTAPGSTAPGSTAPGSTAPGSTAPGSTSAQTVVPYSAVLYHPEGTTWVYTVPQPLTYVREKVVISTVTGVSGAEAVLSSGPVAGTTIVTVGVIELWGAELGVGK